MSEQSIKELIVSVANAIILTMGSLALVIIIITGISIGLIKSEINEKDTIRIEKNN